MSDYRPLVVCLDQLIASELFHQLALRLGISPTMINGLLRRVVQDLPGQDRRYSESHDDYVICHVTCVWYQVVQNINEEQCFVIELVKGMINMHKSSSSLIRFLSVKFTLPKVVVSFMTTVIHSLWWI